MRLHSMESMRAQAAVAIPCADYALHPQVTALQRIAVGSWRVLQPDEAVVLLRDEPGAHAEIQWAVRILPCQCGWKYCQCILMAISSFTFHGGAFCSSCYCKQSASDVAIRCSHYLSGQPFRRKAC